MFGKKKRKKKRPFLTSSSTETVVGCQKIPQNALAGQQLASRCLLSLTHNTVTETLRAITARRLSHDTLTPRSACLVLHLSRLWTPCNTDTSKTCQIIGCAELVALRGEICCCTHQPTVSSAIRLWREMKNKKVKKRRKKSGQDQAFVVMTKVHVHRSPTAFKAPSSQAEMSECSSQLTDSQLPILVKVQKNPFMIQTNL